MSQFKLYLDGDKYFRGVLTEPPRYRTILYKNKPYRLYFPELQFHVCMARSSEIYEVVGYVLLNSGDFVPLLPNVYVAGHICLGKPFKGFSPKQVTLDAVNYFWQSGFTGEFGYKDMEENFLFYLKRGVVVLTHLVATPPKWGEEIEAY